MRLSHIWYLGVKELRSLARDRGMIVLILYAFTLAVYASATAIPETLHRAPLASPVVPSSPVRVAMRVSRLPMPAS